MPALLLFADEPVQQGGQRGIRTASIRKDQLPVWVSLRLYRLHKRAQKTLRCAIERHDDADRRIPCKHGRPLPLQIRSLHAVFSPPALIADCVCAEHNILHALHKLSKALPLQIIDALFADNREAFLPGKHFLAVQRIERLLSAAFHGKTQIVVLRLCKCELKCMCIGKHRLRKFAQNIDPITFHIFRLNRMSGMIQQRHLHLLHSHIPATQLIAAVRQRRQLFYPGHEMPGNAQQLRSGGMVNAASAIRRLVINLHCRKHSCFLTVFGCFEYFSRLFRIRQRHTDKIFRHDVRLIAEIFFRHLHTALHLYIDGRGCAVSLCLELLRPLGIILKPSLNHKCIRLLYIKSNPLPVKFCIHATRVLSLAFCRCFIHLRFPVIHPPVGL